MCAPISQRPPGSANSSLQCDPLSYPHTPLLPPSPQTACLTGPDLSSLARMLPAIAETINKVGGRGEGERAAGHKGSHPYLARRLPSHRIPCCARLSLSRGRVSCWERPSGAALHGRSHRSMLVTHSVGLECVQQSRLEDASPRPPPNPSPATSPCTRAGVGPGWLLPPREGGERHGEQFSMTNRKEASLGDRSWVVQLSGRPKVEEEFLPRKWSGRASKDSVAERKIWKGKPEADERMCKREALLEEG